MIQRELLNEIMRLGNDISRNRIFNSTNPTYIVDGDSLIEWFEQIKNFILSETDVGTQRIWPARAFTLGQLTHHDLASVRIAKRAL